MLEAVRNNMQKGGRFIVSGLVEWNCDRVHTEIEKAGFQREAKAQENEWVTMIYKDKDS